MYGLNDVTVSNNDFQEILTNPLIADGGPLSTSEENFSGNTYNSPAAQSSWMNVNGSAVSFSTWASADETNATAQQVAFPNSSVSVASYNASISGSDSVDAFMAAARSESSQDWQPQYTAAAVIAYRAAVQWKERHQPGRRVCHGPLYCGRVIFRP